MVRFLVFLLKLGFFLGFIGAGIGVYLIYHFSRDLPDYSQLKAYHPPCVTRMYSSDGKLIEEYAKENRIFVPISSMPKSVVEAFIAAEDKNYYSHPGIDIFSIIRAAFTNISHIINKRRVEGGSTITQQVVKNFLLTSERSFERKIKEAILSYMISQSLSKDQILELYLNQIYLGKKSYGVAAAALVYFNKSVEELTIGESAILASLPKAPSKFNPYKNYDRALERRNYVIGRMYADGYITEEEARKNIDEPITLRKRDKVETLNADYYAEQVREEVIGMFGEEYFYTAGLTIITCLDSNMQQAMDGAMTRGIIGYDRKRGFRGPIKNIGLLNWQDDLRRLPIFAGQKNDILAVVLSVNKNNAKIGLFDGSMKSIELSDMSWTRTNIKDVNDILKAGDLIVVSKEGDKYLLSQIPAINGAMMAMEPVTGKVFAISGGYDFDASKFNRATQAMRQPGSLIKTFVYLAALEIGIKPNDIFLDEPMQVSQGQGMPVWAPKNWDDKFMGPMTLRTGLELSRNLITVRVGMKTGLSKIAEVVKKFGINDNPSNVYSILLGALETTLERMVTAFGIIANNGKKVTPHYVELIKDRKGTVIYRRDYTDCAQCKSYKYDNNGVILPPVINKGEEKMVTDEATSYQITSILMGGVERGTSSGAKVLGKIMAGKTGTTNDAKDIWFVGYTPRIVAGVYIGYDQPKSLGKRVFGSSLAVPFFVDFMKNAYADYPSVDFMVPKSIELINIDRKTGQYSTGSGSILEAFKKNSYNNNVNDNNSPEIEKNHDVFKHINDIDSSHELY